MYYILFNPKASGNKGTQKAKELEGILKDAELVFRSVLEIDNYKNFIASLTEDDKIVVVGGDGTLNRFINDIRGLKVTNDVYYFPAGTGNDFLRDLGLENSVGPHKINKYLEELPRVIVCLSARLYFLGLGAAVVGLPQGTVHRHVPVVFLARACEYQRARAGLAAAEVQVVVA